jgi:hypothetical protein
MTEQQQPDSTEYPPHWTPWIERREANPISSMTSRMGFDDGHTPTADTDTSYPAHWRI